MLTEGYFAQMVHHNLCLWFTTSHDLLLSVLGERIWKEESACMCSSLADESGEGSRKFESTRSAALLPSESPRALYAILPSTGTQWGLKHTLHAYL